MQPPDSHDHSDTGYSRRSFMKGVSAGGVCLSAGATLLPGCGDTPSAPKETSSHAVGPIEMIDVSFKINGKANKAKIDPRTTLLDHLRENMALTGSKKGCDHGQCGACTVLINGRTMNACLALAAAYSGSEITTIEGLGSDTELHPVQASFLKHDAFQCGYCTPGQIMSAAALVKTAKKFSADEVREYMSGNICRCGAYPNIVAAVMEATQSAAGQEKHA